VRASATATLLAGLVLAAEPAARGEETGRPPIAVIVGTGSAVTQVSVDDLRELYLRRRRLWRDGRRAIPINLPAGNPARERFSRLVLGRATRDLVAYWDARYFEGITPPTVLPSAAAIRAYLAAEPAAIAYLPLGDVDDTCRIVGVLGR
jgi:hypothetical protein